MRYQWRFTAALLMLAEAAAIAVFWPWISDGDPLGRLMMWVMALLLAPDVAAAWFWAVAKDQRHR
jgi:hypothetical protein